MFFNQPTILAENRIITEKAQTKYYFPDQINRLTEPFQNTNVARSTGVIGNKMDHSNALRYTALTREKGNISTVEEPRFSATTPNLINMQGIPEMYDQVVTLDPTRPLSGGCDRTNTETVHYNRQAANSIYGNAIQDGYSTSQGLQSLHQPMGTRNVIHDFYTEKNINFRHH